MTLLAVSDNLAFWLPTCIAGAAVLLSFVAIWTSRSDRNSDELRNLRDEMIKNRTLIEVTDKRLSAGDGHFKRTDERMGRLEVQIVQSIAELSERVATKDDMREMREELRRD